ncbi:hypothetical protein ACQEVC_12905 [Plantactinospora sp. CA-294935]|uniref:hypothetical protein n=1 Tax=Plantactinospora sp. CA-294935 TaxID=3240012 RepID=UPI003D9333A9
MIINDDWVDRAERKIADAWGLAAAASDRRGALNRSNPAEVGLYAELTQADAAMARVWVEMAKAEALITIGKTLAYMQDAVQGSLGSDEQQPSGWRSWLRRR